MISIEVKLDRIRKGITQVKMAEAMGMSKALFSAKENGRIKFTIPERVQVAKMLGYSFKEMNDKLFDGVFDFFVQELPDGNGVLS